MTYVNMFYGAVNGGLTPNIGKKKENTVYFIMY